MQTRGYGRIVIYEFHRQNTKEQIWIKMFAMFFGSLTVLLLSIKQVGEEPFLFLMLITFLIPVHVFLALL